MGRGVRRDSHKNSKNKIVNIHKLYLINQLDIPFIQTGEGETYSTDMFMKKYGDQKQLLINTFLTDLEQHSIENLSCDTNFKFQFLKLGSTKLKIAPIPDFKSKTTTIIH